MKTLLDCRLARLAAQTSCPNCGDLRDHFVCNGIEHADADEPDSYLMNPDDKAAAAYGCGSEFAIDENDDIVCRKPCYGPSEAEAADMNQEAEQDFDEQEEAVAA